MAVTTTKLPNTTIGITYSVTTDSSSDWASVSNDVYFFDKATDLPYYKNASGTVVSIFEEGGGGGDTFVTGGTYSGSTIILNRNDGNSVNVTGITSDSIYTADDALTGNRTVDLDGNDLDISYSSSNSGQLKVTSTEARLRCKDSSDNTFNLLELNYNDSIFVVKRKFEVRGLNNTTSFRPIDITANTTHRLLMSTIQTSLGTTADNFDTNNNTTGIIRNGTLRLYATDTKTVLKSNTVILSSSNINNAIGSEDISLQGSTLIKGNGTSTGSALAIYNNDTTPFKQWDFLDNGRVERVGAISIGENQSLTDARTISLGKNVSSSGFDTVSIGQSLTTSDNYTTNIGASNTVSGSLGLCIGAFNTVTGNLNFGIGSDSFLTGSKNIGIGARIYSSFNDTIGIGKFILSNSNGASVIGYGVSTSNRLTNSTADSLALGWNTTTPQHLIKSTGAEFGGTTELTATDGGFLMNRLTTAQKNAISSPDTNLMVFDTDLESIERYDGTNWVSQANYGLISINDANGTPVFYNNLNGAISAANAGQAIELHGNIVESNNTVITIDKELTINMNGYTYSCTSTGTADGIYVNTSSKVKILNGTIKRSGGTYGSTSNRALVVASGSNLELTGTDIINTTGMSLYSTGSSTNILNGRFITTSQTISQVSIQSSANMIGSIIESSAYNNFAGEIKGLNIKSAVSTSLNGGHASNCVFNQTSASGYDALIISGGGEATHCRAYNVSTTYPAIRISGANTKIQFCYGYSTLDNGIESGSGSPKGVYNCIGVNAGGNKYGGQFSTIEDGVYNSTFITLSGYGAVANSGSNKFVKCNFINKNAGTTNASFYDYNSGTVRVYDCYSEQADSTKPNLRFTNASKVVYLAGNKLQGGTGVSIAHADGNSQNTTTDDYGNIILE